MLKLRHFALAALLMLIASSSSIWAQKVSVDWDKAADFSSLKTYSWTEGTTAKNPLMNERIVSAIDAQLAAKGLRKVETAENPDVIILYHAATSEETQLNTISAGNGWGWRWGGMAPTTTTVSKIPMGQLVVDLVNANSKKLIWLGNASDTLSDKPEKNEQKINKAVEKMFKKFPPPVKN